jgi:hypothetical protein
MISFVEQESLDMFAYICVAVIVSVIHLQCMYVCSAYWLGMNDRMNCQEY